MSGASKYINWAFFYYILITEKLVFSQHLTHRALETDNISQPTSHLTLCHKYRHTCKYSNNYPRVLVISIYICKLWLWIHVFYSDNMKRKTQNLRYLTLSRPSQSGCNWFIWTHKDLRLWVQTNCCLKKSTNKSSVVCKSWGGALNLLIEIYCKGPVYSNQIEKWGIFFKISAQSIEHVQKCIKPKNGHYVEKNPSF